MGRCLSTLWHKTDLVVDDHVVLGGHVVSNVMIHNQPQQSVQESQINLLIQLLEMTLHHDIALSLPSVPHLLQIVDACRTHPLSLFLSNPISKDGSPYYIGIYASFLKFVGFFIYL